MNNSTLVGRLTKDPELRYTPSGVAIARFTLAVNRTFANQQGEREADFISIIVWRKQAENVANFLKKGSLCGVIGRIQTGSYEGQDGKKVYTTDVVAQEVQFLDKKGSDNGNSNGGGSNNSNQSNGGNQRPNNSSQQNNYNQQNYSRVDEDPFGSSTGPIEVSDDDLPF